MEINSGRLFKPLIYSYSLANSGIKNNLAKQIKYAEFKSENAGCLSTETRKFKLRPFLKEL